MTRIIITTAAGRPRPRAGDTRRTKRHGLQIRVQCMARDFAGQPIGRIVRDGRPVFDWRKPVELDQWDLHLLQRPEISAELAKEKTKVTSQREPEYIFGEPLLPRTQVDQVDAAHELIAMQLDIPSISAHALQQWCEAVITASLMARMTGTGDDEMGHICDHLQHLINSRQPDGSLLLTDADRERIADAVDTMTAVASVTPDRIARMCAEACEAAMKSGRLPEMLNAARGGR